MKNIENVLCSLRRFFITKATQEKRVVDKAIVGDKESELGNEVERRGEDMAEKEDLIVHINRV